MLHAGARFERVAELDRIALLACEIHPEHVRFDVLGIAREDLANENERTGVVAGVTHGDGGAELEIGLRLRSVRELGEMTEERRGLRHLAAALVKVGEITQRRLVVGPIAKQALELGARLFDATEALLEDRGTTQTNRAQSITTLHPTEPRGFAREVRDQARIVVATDEDRLDRAVGFFVVTGVLYLYVLAVVVDSAILWFRLKKALVAKFGPAAARGNLMYAVLRATQLPRTRLPRPMVKRGGAPVQPKAPKA